MSIPYFVIAAGVSAVVVRLPDAVAGLCPVGPQEVEAITIAIASTPNVCLTPRKRYGATLGYESPVAPARKIA